MYKVDDRGSKDQRILYDWLFQLYGNVVYEYQLKELGQRVDLYIPSLGIAVEYNGRQHYEFVEHFHKHYADFEFGQYLDRKKESYLIEHGIKLVIVPYDKMVNSVEELKELIDSVPYPDMEYTPVDNDTTDFYKERNKEQSKKLRSEIATKCKEPDEDRKARLAKEKQYRRERYKKMKEKLKE